MLKNNAKTEELKTKLREEFEGFLNFPSYAALCRFEDVAIQFRSEMLVLNGPIALPAVTKNEHSNS